MKALYKKFIPKLYGALLNVYVYLNPKKAAQKAFTIFTKVRKGRVSPHQKEYLDPVKHQRI